eukprot:TRINITY_DN2330_c0_g1_i1.p1 TRINITY_DN2330_c0_g1~~TRINITY_DN2330_c0_g1_i1.p1  ORF type:complete len:267 (+),score=75.09 TRINITY_DN2330_c0_g1_i1:93-893(+)
MVQIEVLENYDAICKRAAAVIVEAIRAHGDKKKRPFVLGLATGSTPIGVYKELIRIHKEENFDFSKIVTFNLDEYLGLPHSHPECYHSFMNTNLFDHINVTRENIHVPEGDFSGADAEQRATEQARKYEEAITNAGGIDLQLLGIGTNGHVAFNEPIAEDGNHHSYSSTRTRVVALEQSTRQDNARFFNNDINSVPTHAVTMGLGTILDARRLLLIANGAGKADAIANTLEGPAASVTCPASIIQKHADTLVLIDTAAASKLKNTH